MAKKKQGTDRGLTTLAKWTSDEMGVQPANVAKRRKGVLWNSAPLPAKSWARRVVARGQNGGYRDFHVE